MYRVVSEGLLDGIVGQRKKLIEVSSCKLNYSSENYCYCFLQFFYAEELTKFNIDLIIQKLCPDFSRHCRLPFIISTVTGRQRACARVRVG